MARHAGDSGNWNQNAAAPKRMSIRERVNTQLGVTSPEVVAEMKREETFLDSVRGKPPERRFTDRRPPPGRTRLIP